MRTTLRRLFTIAALTLTAVLAATTASAVLTARVGSDTERQHFITEDTVFTTGNAFWTNVPGATRRVIIGPGTRRMLDVRYTAESACTGPAAAGYCSVRIIVQYPSGFRQELDPADGTDFAFDSVSTSGDDDQWEAHAMERSSVWLRPGTYRVIVQATVVGGATQFWLDDWHLYVGVVAP